MRPAKITQETSISETNKKPPPSKELAVLSTEFSSLYSHLVAHNYLSTTAAGNLELKTDLPWVLMWCHRFVILPLGRQRRWIPGAHCWLASLATVKFWPMRDAVSKINQERP